MGCLVYFIIDVFGYKHLYINQKYTTNRNTFNSIFHNSYLSEQWNIKNKFKKLDEILDRVYRVIMAIKVE